MKAADIIAADNSTNLDQEVLDALYAFGYYQVDLSLYQRQHPSQWFCILTAFHRDGGQRDWAGHGLTVEDAKWDAIDAVAKWMLQQPLPVTP